MRRRRSKPTPGRPKGSSGDLTQRRVLSAARTCFGQWGYERTTNKMVAAEAGLTAAALYRYFDSKVEMYLAAVADAIGELVPHYQAALGGRASARVTLGRLLTASAAVHAADPSLATFLSSIPVEIRRNPEIASAMEAQPDAVSVLIAQIVDEAHRRGELSKDITPHAVVSMFLACTMGLSLWVATIEPDGAGDSIRAFGKLLDGSLFRRR